jgi:uncharacterized metal-binding protein YceD (DUF177 family)
MRFVFFTGDGQIGLSFEKLEVGDLVIELDRRTAESLVLRKSGDLYTLVTISRKVLGAWWLTPLRSLKKFTTSVDISTLQALSKYFPGGRAVDDQAEPAMAQPRGSVHVYPSTPSLTPAT